ncbi:MAG TPA: hypothetical protein VFR58_05315 [Flavisolibacter sp.]|nr:hypothetical protein [Flavisolibacter sp.]
MRQLLLISAFTSLFACSQRSRNINITVATETGEEKLPGVLVVSGQKQAAMLGDTTYILSASNGDDVRVTLEGYVPVEFNIKDGVESYGIFLAARK